MSFKIVVYLSIIIGFFGAFIVLFRLYKDYIHQYIIDIFSDYYDDKSLTDEERYRDYLKKKQKEIIKNQLVSKNLMELSYKDNVKIVEVIEPIGKWTKFVISEKLRRLVGMRFNNKNQSGFWQMLIRMQGLAQGRYKGRSR
ncbi:hypothetical protein HL033_03650 [Neoehrlichia mikurensis]|uniref:Uncharacterized protein n=1 Tax=Neoehrlichia mikurensis TaxID=89586 RepID=A0A9Q9BYR9_9RICK|nr:hypothetical protein [Neoehrlichia mikurensis]QXK91827.1 hypothetical protein IAH97_03645 [Neoehrlichia mikurensis]QXK93039.1 hypothetical protein HUN61_03640 [Neoehrlichia mikurensis]QXK93517.1 hypothetical protein HL033_03650 [Neoehrlichia mikurensis]UTO55528.1 hypothetical protein LUA82_00305 [Neoehrlichia mikurensis]UTO56449.1 hypothetical protein LUA81_00305 [Neoehrlichia mikurensis]